MSQSSFWELRRVQVSRIVRTIATGEQDRRQYPARAVEILRNRLPGIEDWKPQALADRIVEMFWNALSPGVRSWKYTQRLGRWIHRRARRVQPRGGGCFTRFCRNMPQLELVRDLVFEKPEGAPLRIASLGCSTGAELYSLLWLIRTARPAQSVQALGIDTDEECIQAASRGVYPCRVVEVAQVSATSHERLFTKERKTLVVQDWLKETITWAVGDACSPDLVARFGRHDLVLANNFLCHMSPKGAAACLRNLTQLVAPNGYLVASGVDLDLRSSVLAGLGFVPVTARCEEIHAAEDRRAAWPLRSWGLEPMDRTRQDWVARYATVFMSPASAGGAAQ